MFNICSLDPGAQHQHTTKFLPKQHVPTQAKFERYQRFVERQPVKPIRNQNLL